MDLWREMVLWKLTLCKEEYKFSLNLQILIKQDLIVKFLQGPRQGVNPEDLTIVATCQMIYVTCLHRGNGREIQLLS